MKNFIVGIVVLIVIVVLPFTWFDYVLHNNDIHRYSGKDSWHAVNVDSYLCKLENFRSSYFKTWIIWLSVAVGLFVGFVFRKDLDKTPSTTVFEKIVNSIGYAAIWSFMFWLWLWGLFYLFGPFISLVVCWDFYQTFHDRWILLIMVGGCLFIVYYLFFDFDGPCQQ